MKISTIFFTFFFRLAPSRSPELVTAQKSSSMSLVVRWSQIPADDFQGQPIGYKIMYYSVKFGNEINFVNENYTSNTTILTNLSAFTVYVVNVSAVSSGGIGPASTAMARTGAEGRK